MNKRNGGIVMKHKFFTKTTRLLALILKYDDLCRDAITKGAATAQLFAVPAREKIGRAKSVDAEEYVAAYEAISKALEEEIAAIVEQGGEDK